MSDKAKSAKQRDTDTLQADLSSLDVNSGSGESRLRKNGALDIPQPPVDLIEPVLTDNAVTVLRRRYLAKDENGEVAESPREMFWRVAFTIASGDQIHRPDLDVGSQARVYYELMSSLDFLPNSPTLMNAGRRLGQLSACFVLPVEDSMEGIFETVKHAALVHKSGGGTGFSFSRLRPKASMVQSTAGTASGPVSFMTVFNAATETVKQGGTRRGANMGILRVDHPDIREFIACKQDMVSITNFNISVAVTDKFMKALEAGESYDLIAPHTGKVAGSEDAREIFDLIAENAWRNGDPGLVFIDEINRKEPTPHIGYVEATNPCGEQPLLPYESCNLGSINLANIVTPQQQVDWERLRRIVKWSVRFLDNIIDMNRFPIPQIEKMTLGNRRIGLGVMGFADLLYAMRIPYDSDDAITMAREVMEFIGIEARKTSDELAEERGSFPNWEGSKFDVPTRNSTVTTIAPTGTISMIADTSGGIEPNFALVYVKRVMDDDRLLYMNRHFEDAAKAGGWFSRDLMEKIAAGAYLAKLAEVPDDAKRIFVTAHDITPEWHVRMQAAFQEFCENAVSKTINFPNSATVDDVKRAYMLAWRLKCKGITIYRDGSRSTQVLNVGDSQLAKGGTGGISETGQQELSPVKRVLQEPLRPGTGYLKPRHRPRITRGYTESIRTGEGTLFVTINEDEHGLCEVFASIGKSGGNAQAQSEAIGRLISLALRAGVDPHEIVKQLKGIMGPNPIWHEGELIRSTPDAIGGAIERHLERKTQKQAELPLEGTKPEPTVAAAPEEPKPTAPQITFANGFEMKEQCPDCSSPVIYEEGCLVCRHCGYSKCE